MNSALSLFRTGAQSVSDDVVAGDWNCQPAACGTGLGPNHLPLYTGTCTCTCICICLTYMYRLTCTC